MTKKQLLMELLSVTHSINPHKKHGHHKENGEKKPEKDELRMQPSAKNVLLILLEEKNINQRTISKRLNITAQGVSDVIKKLENKELIVREKGEVYNENIITLTEKGMSVAKKLDEQSTASSQKLFENFSDDDLKKFEELLAKINK
ncbi:MAG: winged helix-turn-helix transcriptional regulator [Clostridia bacterium]